MKARRTWNDKLHDTKDFPRVFAITGKMSKRWGEGTCVIPSPLEVDALMARVSKGKLTTIDGLRRVLARKHRATMACPITTGIFAWIAAHAAEESERAGKKRITPYWRTLKTNGELNPKYPGGIAAMVARLEAEGHTIVQRRKRFFIADFERALATFTPKPSSTSRPAA